MKFLLVVPSIDDYVRTPRNARRTAAAQQSAWEQPCRQRWRALLLVIKAKLDAVTAGISTMEAEFLSNIVLPDTTTAGDWMIPQIDQAYRTGEMPPMLPAGGGQGGRPIALPPVENRAS